MTDFQSELQNAVGQAYRLERELGGGGMSRVFVAEEVAFGRRVVIKVLAPELRATVDADRFRREIQLAAQLQHPGIVPLLTAGTNGELLWYIMPLVDGESLRGLLARGALALSEATSLWRDLLGALAYAHSRGVVHRDIKPENIMVTGGRAVVLDFGVAKAVSASTGSASATSTGLGMAIGTPAYMAPEQAAGEATVDARADLYAASLVMYEMLAGKGPFDATSAASLMAAHIATAPTSLDLHRAGIPASLTALVMQGLAKRPEDRPASAQDVIPRLGTLASGADREPVAAPPVARASRARRTWSGAAAGAALLAVVWFGLKASRGNSSDEPVPTDDTTRLQVAFLPAQYDAGDSVLARSSASALLTELQLAPQLTPLGDEQIALLASDVGVELPQLRADTVRNIIRDLGVHVYLSRALVRVGTGLLFTTEAHATKNDSTLFRLEEPAASVSEVTSALARLNGRTRELLVESAGRVAPPMASGRALGTNAEAARLYIEAQAPWSRADFLGAATKLKAAVTADPEFGRAWSMYSQAWSNLGTRPQEAFDAAMRAYAVRDRIKSRAERLYVEAFYFRLIGDSAQIPLLLSALQRANTPSYVRDFRVSLSNAYARRRQFALAISITSQVLNSEATPSVSAAGNLALSYVRSGQTERARQFADSLALKWGETHPAVRRARERVLQASTLPDTIIGGANLRLRSALTQSDTLRALRLLRYGVGLAGRLDSANVVRTRLATLVESINSNSDLASLHARDAIRRAVLLANPTEARKDLDTRLRAMRWDTVSVLDRAYPLVIEARVATGELAEARRLLAEWERRRPARLDGAEAASAIARGQIALAEGNARDALEASRIGNTGWCANCASPLMAQAFDALDMRDSAVVYYEKFLADFTPGQEDNVVELPRAYRRLAELYEARGDTRKALQRYSDFVTLWKNADPALQPLVQAARDRMAKLQGKRG